MPIVIYSHLSKHKNVKERSLLTSVAVREEWWCGVPILYDGEMGGGGGGWVAHLHDTN